MNRKHTFGNSLVWLLTLLAVGVLLTACSPTATQGPPQIVTGAPDPTLSSAAGFRYWYPLDWTELAAGDGPCGPTEYCMTGDEGVILAAWMTALDEGCSQAGSLKECLDRVLADYEQAIPGYTFGSRENYTTYFGLTGEVIEYTRDGGQTQVRELWTHSENLRLRLRFQGPAATYKDWRSITHETFLSARINRGD